jgi:hypothetical protein
MVELGVVESMLVLANDKYYVSVGASHASVVAENDIYATCLS